MSKSMLTYEEEKMIHTLVSTVARKFRSSPKDDYLKETANFLISKNLSPSLVASILNKATNEFDHFPSLAQLFKLVDTELNFKLPPEAFKHPPAPPPKVPGWTLAHEGLFLGFEQTGLPSHFGLTYCKIKEDEFLEAYHEWKHGRVHPAAKRITGKERLYDSFG